MLKWIPRGYIFQILMLEVKEKQYNSLSRCSLAAKKKNKNKIVNNT